MPKTIKRKPVNASWDKVMAASDKGANPLDNNTESSSYSLQPKMMPITMLLALMGISYIAATVKAEDASVEDPSGLIMTITEDDNQPDVNGKEMTWKYHVLNNSNLVPVGAPGRLTRIEKIKIEDVYSTQAPLVPQLMNGWTTQIIVDGENNFDILLDASNSFYYISPGKTGNFSITTFVSTEGNQAVIGNNVAQAYMYTNYGGKDWLPASGVPIVGPIGEQSIEQMLQNEADSKYWNINITNPPVADPENDPVNVQIDIDGIYSINGEFMGDKILQVLVGNHNITMPNYEYNTTYGVLTPEGAVFSGIVGRFNGEQGSGMRTDDPMFFIGLTAEGVYIDDSKHISYPAGAQTIQLTGLQLEPLAENPYGKYIFDTERDPLFGFIPINYRDSLWFSRFWQCLVSEGAPVFIDLNGDGRVDIHDLLMFLEGGYLHQVHILNINGSNE
jgi:hypothetical protein